MVSDMMRGALLPRIYIALLAAPLSQAVIHPRLSRVCRAVDRLCEVGPAEADLVDRTAPRLLPALGHRLAADALVEIARRIVAQDPQETAPVPFIDHRREGCRQKLSADAALVEIRLDIERIDLADLCVAFAGKASRAIAVPRRPETGEADHAMIGLGGDDHRVRFGAVADGPGPLARLLLVRHAEQPAMRQDRGISRSPCIDIDFGDSRSIPLGRRPDGRHGASLARVQPAGSLR